MQIFRWELREPSKHLSPDECAAIAARRQERDAARQECVDLLSRMSDPEKAELVKASTSGKTEAKKVEPEVRIDSDIVFLVDSSLHDIDLADRLELAASSGIIRHTEKNT